MSTIRWMCDICKKVHETQELAEKCEKDHEVMEAYKYTINSVNGYTGVIMNITTADGRDFAFRFRKRLL